VPDESYWNIGMNPPELKKYWLKNKIYPEHGKDSSKYFAIESNPKTRRMYKKEEIVAYPKEKII
jgi:hypothetical protein